MQVEARITSNCLTKFITTDKLHSYAKYIKILHAGAIDAVKNDSTVDKASVGSSSTITITFKCGLFLPLLSALLTEVNSIIRIEELF